MMDERPLGLVIMLVGAAGAIISALADPLGIGQAEGFGWLQMLGLILGIVVALLGLALSMAWIPYPGRADTVSNPGQNTTVITDTTPRDPAP